MTTEQWLTIGIVVIAVLLFISEWLTVDLIGLILISLLIITGILTPSEAVRGFSNSATITIASMFVLSAALLKTGQLKFIANYFSGLLIRNKTAGILLLMLFAGIISAFINNTPVVAVFIPIVLDAAVKAGISASKILIPLSFASMFGGLCSLIGTSSNILVSDIAVEHKLPAFGMFEMLPAGIVFFAVGILYLLVANKLIPARNVPDTLTVKYHIGNYLTDVQLLPNSPSIGRAISESPLYNELKIEIIGFRRSSEQIAEPNYATVLQEGDILRISGNIEQIKKIQVRQGIEILKENEWKQSIKEPENLVLAEALITPGSELEGKTLSQANFKTTYGAFALAIRSRMLLFKKKMHKTMLGAGDVLLISTKKEVLDVYKQKQNQQETPFLIISEIETDQKVNWKQTAFVVFIIAFVILLASFNILPIVASSVVGVTVLVLSGFIDMQEVYKAINWKIIFLIAGSISLGLALEKTDTAKFMAEELIGFVGGMGPIAMLSALYLITSILTELISNAASAVLLSPVAISAAEVMDVSSRPFLLAIMFAASASFMTPVGYQTNTMIYSAGNYKYADFFRVGAPLNLIFWILATLLIPLFFKF
jgi:di/tricarboxylate transporter